MNWPADKQDWFDCEVELQDLATMIISQVDIRYKQDGLNDPVVYGATLLFRTLNSTRAAFELAAREHLIEANLIARSCIENVLWLRGLQQKGLAFVQEILGDGMRAEAALAELILEFPDLSLDEDSQRLVQAQIAAKTKTRIELRKVSSSPAAATEYALFRMISNNFAHPSIRSLDRHLIRDHQTGAYTLTVDPIVQPRELLWAMFAAAAAAISAIGLFLETFPIENQSIFNDRGYGEKLSDLENRFRALGREEGFAGPGES